MKYEITEVDRQDDWENNYGKYASFLVRFQGHDGQVQINRKFKGNEVKEPKVGEELEGSIEIQANGVPKFKQDYSGGSFSGGSKSDKPSEEYWRGKDKRISRQHSQEMALRLLIANKKDDQIISMDLVKKAADEFDNDLPELPSA